jgi:hypothetical protein
VVSGELMVSGMIMFYETHKHENKKKIVYLEAELNCYGSCVQIFKTLRDSTLNACLIRADTYKQKTAKNGTLALPGLSFVAWLMLLTDHSIAITHQIRVFTSSAQ